jgi:hypothetical protein
MSLTRTQELRVPNGSRASLGGIIQLSDNERIIYEFIPGIHVICGDVKVTINSEGFRDKSYDIEKDDDTVRIIGLGDSFMFGHAVPDGKEYLTFLENRLNMEQPHMKWEAVNTAVSGYNTVMELATLKEKGLKYKPDIVILGYVANDMNLPNFIKNKEDYFSVRKSFFQEYVAELFKLRRKKATTPLVPPPDKFGNRYADTDFETDPSKVPARYRDMIGLDAVHRALDELGNLSIKEGFKVIVTSFQLNRDENSISVLRKCEELGFHVVDIGKSIKEYMEANNIPDYSGSYLVASLNDSHPSAFTHKFASDVIYSYMLENGLLEMPSGHERR